MSIDVKNTAASRSAVARAPWLWPSPWSHPARVPSPLGPPGLCQRLLVCRRVCVSDYWCAIGLCWRKLLCDRALRVCVSAYVCATGLCWRKPLEQAGVVIEFELNGKAVERCPTPVSRCSRCCVTISGWCLRRTVAARRGSAVAARFGSTAKHEFRASHQRNGSPADR